MMEPTVKTDKYELYLGKAEDIMPQLPQGCADAVICDPPYGTTACKWDTVIPLDVMWELCHYAAKNNTTFVFTANQPFSSVLVSSQLETFKYAWVWEKNRPTGAQMCKNRPMGRHEDVLIFSSAPMGHVSLLGDRRMTYNPQGVTSGQMKTIKERGFHGRHIGKRPNQVGRTYTSMTGFPHTVLKFDKDEGHLHPTQKPVALMEYLVKTYTNEGETVLDFTFGSGTTGVAAIKNNRYFIGIESDEKYFEIAAKRLADCASQGMLEFSEDKE